MGQDNALTAGRIPHTDFDMEDKNNSLPPRKLDAVVAAMRSGDWPRAISLAAKFPSLGDEKREIMQANEALKRPEFQRQLGRDPAQLIAAGQMALIRRYGSHV